MYLQSATKGFNMVLTMQQRNNATVRASAIRVSEAWHKWLRIESAKLGIGIGAMAERCFLKFRGSRKAK